jgi:hypothetical protein
LEKTRGNMNATRAGQKLQVPRKARHHVPHWKRDEVIAKQRAEEKQRRKEEGERLALVHRDIPKDANGDPIFLVLPDGVRANYERKMRKCEIGWKASGDPAFVAEAQTWTHLHRQPPPLWLSEAVIEVCAVRRTKGDVTRGYNAAVRWMRYDAVRRAAERMPWEDAYGAAAEELSRIRGAGTARTARMMKKAYVEVAADIRNGHGAYYLSPLIPKKKLSDTLRRKPPSKRRSERQTPS